ncbi:MAG: hypothetical protein RLZZ324_1360, partial [Candidatus Parcubacteria bacterium]
MSPTGYERFSLKELFCAASVAAESVLLRVNVPHRWSLTVDDVSTGLLPPRGQARRDAQQGVATPTLPLHSTRIDLKVRDPLTGERLDACVVIDLKRLRI